jgi:membrane protein implicated in regulation of membrane protease activity
MHTWTWFALGGVCAVLEVLNLSLVFASFAIGAVAAVLASWAGANTPTQWVIFAVATVLSLRLKPILTRYIFRKTPPSDTGIAALVGQKAVATSPITDSAGTITLKNETWTARSEVGEIPAGSTVTVARIDGALAIVIPQNLDPLI